MRIQSPNGLKGWHRPAKSAFGLGRNAVFSWMARIPGLEHSEKVVWEPPHGPGVDLRWKRALNYDHSHGIFVFGWGPRAKFEFVLV